MPTTRNLAILIFEDVEVLDFCGPFDVFSVANRFTELPVFHVLAVAERDGPVVSCGYLSVNPHHRLTDSPQPDVLLVPGGRPAILPGKAERRRPLGPVARYRVVLDATC